MEHLLIIRFSSLGDVAMTVPVVASLARQYPNLRITMLSRESVRPLFRLLPPNVHFMGADLKNEYHGVSGLRKLYFRLAAKNFTLVADLHDVLRSKYLRTRLNIAGMKVQHIDKNRLERYKMLKMHQDLHPQKSIFEKYTDVFAKLKYPINLDFTSVFGPDGGDLSTLPEPMEKRAGECWIGIAPFAAHEGKIYPTAKMEQVIKALSARADAPTIFLFGAGAREGKILVEWAERYPRVISTVGLMRSMMDDLVLMSHLDVMLSMDSANMHLTSLVNVPVVSVWGATHPCMGFLGWRQKAENVVSVDLPCRPCSVYGNKRCRRGDYACLTSIEPEHIVQKINQIIDTP